MKVYLVYNVDPSYMDNFLMDIFSSREKAEACAFITIDKTHIVEWEVE